MDKKQCPDCGEWIYGRELEMHRQKADDDQHGPSGQIHDTERINSDDDSSSSFQGQLTADEIPVNRGRTWAGPKAFSDNQCPETVEGELAALHGELTGLQNRQATFHDELTQLQDRQAELCDELNQEADRTEALKTTLQEEIRSLTKLVNGLEMETNGVKDSGTLTEILLDKCPRCKTHGITQRTGRLWWKSKAGTCKNCGYELLTE